MFGLTIKRSIGIGLLVRLLLPLLGSQLDHVIDPEYGDGCFCRKLQGFNLGDSGLEDSSLLVVPYHSFNEVQATVLQLTVLCLGLRGVVIGSQLSDKITGIFSRVDSQCFGNDEKRFSEVCDGELLSAREGSGKILEID